MLMRPGIAMRGSNTEVCECPRCKEISLKPLYEPEIDDDIIEWECSCGHFQITTNANYVPMFFKDQIG